MPKEELKKKKRNKKMNFGKLISIKISQNLFNKLSILFLNNPKLKKSSVLRNILEIGVENYK